jgi:deazaflavin-dependent oxidoreductase (nitroreductase family)
MSEPFEQDATGAMTYPAQGTINRFLFKMPLILWRMGLGRLLNRQMLVLTTWGRNSNLPRYAMVSYTLYQAKYYIISGWGDRTDWYKNILVNPRVTVQVDRPHFPANAQRVTYPKEFAAVMAILFQTGGDSHFEPWLKSLDIPYDLEAAIENRDHVHLVALAPADLLGPPPIPIDLIWLWPLVLSVLGFGWVKWKWMRARGRR